MRWLPQVVELAGLGAVVAGVELRFGVWLALIVGGVLAVVGALALERLGADKEAA